MQLEAISSRPTASYLGEETNTHLTTTAFQVVVVMAREDPSCRDSLLFPEWD